MEHDPQYSIWDHIKPTHISRGGVYSSFKAMEMIQGILGFEIFNSGILEGRGREILENMFWGIDVLSQFLLKHTST